MHNGPNPLLVTLIAILVLLPLLYRRMRKLSRGMPLKLNRLWLRPALILAACALVLFGPQPGQAVRVFTAMDWAWLALAAMAGAAGGWQMGRTMAIEVHPEDGTLMVKGGQAAMLVIVVLILLRLGLKTGLQLEGQALHWDVLLISDAAIVFTALLFTVRAAEMYLRAKKVLEQAKTLP
jgi:hypothetical protein